MADIDGKSVDLSAYSGKVVMIVNVASFCGYTRQYGPLEELYEKYKSQGFVVLGFPANDFGAQEPGTDVEIKEFCTSKYLVTFPMFSKITVKGDGKHPLYKWLTAGAPPEVPAGEVGWNFEKFLIGKDGRLIHRYSTRTEPNDTAVVADIEQALGS